MYLHRAIVLGSAALLMAASLLSGCALSESSGSISDSASSPFGWSSSSSPDDDSAMYREDVERLTVAHVRAGGDPASLRQSLTGLSGQQGITDWMSDEQTLRAVGTGLRAADLGDAERRSFAARLLGEQDESLLQLAEGGAR